MYKKFQLKIVWFLLESLIWNFIFEINCKTLSKNDKGCRKWEKYIIILIDYH